MEPMTFLLCAGVLLAASILIDEDMEKTKSVNTVSKQRRMRR